MQVKVYVYELPPQYNVWLYSELNTVASYAYRDGLYAALLHPPCPGGFCLRRRERWTLVSSRTRSL